MYTCIYISVPIFTLAHVCMCKGHMRAPICVCIGGLGLVWFTKASIVQCSGNTLHYPATHCNLLQHPATTHIITLQHTATHCNTLITSASLLFMSLEMLGPLLISFFVVKPRLGSLSFGDFE